MICFLVETNREISVVAIRRTLPSPSILVGRSLSLLDAASKGPLGLLDGLGSLVVLLALLAVLRSEEAPAVVLVGGCKEENMFRRFTNCMNVLRRGENMHYFVICSIS
jgi:hypothetical protein